MMKTCVTTILLLLLTVATAHAVGIKVNRNADPYVVGVEINRNPLVVGDNPIAIEIRDGAGKIITDAKVLVNYYMPPMPRMAPMNYSTAADLRGKIYKATMDCIMAGPWYVRIIINRGGSTVTTKFNVDAQ